MCRAGHRARPQRQSDPLTRALGRGRPSRRRGQGGRQLRGPAGRGGQRRPGTGPGAWDVSVMSAPELAVLVPHLISSHPLTLLRRSPVPNTPPLHPGIMTLPLTPGRRTSCLQLNSPHLPSSIKARDGLGRGEKLDNNITTQIARGNILH